jgi:hypothetical protein
VFVRQNRLRCDRGELGEESALRLRLLDDRLDHEVAAGEVGQLSRRRQPRERSVLLLLCEPLLLDAAGEVAVDRGARPLAELHRDLAPDRLEAGLDADLRDPGTHRAESDHADPPYCHRHGS